MLHTERLRWNMACLAVCMVCPFVDVGLPVRMSSGILRRKRTPMLTILLDDGPAGEWPAIPEHTPVVFVYQPLEGLAPTVWMDGVLLEPFLLSGDPAWRWRWNPGAAAGWHTLVLQRDPHAPPVVGRLRVAPARLETERYEALLDELQQTALDLVVALTKSVETVAFEPQERPASRLDDHVLFGARLARFERALRRIAAQPRPKLQRITRLRGTGELQRPDPQALIMAAVRASDPAPPELAANLPGGRLPQTVPESTAADTNDTDEHRLALHIIGILRRRTRSRVRLPDDVRTDVERRLNALAALPIFQGVQALGSFHGPSQVMQHNPFYREIYRMWQDLRRTPALSFVDQSDTLPISEMPRLYERWCVLRTMRAMLSLGGRLVEQQVLEVRQDASGLGEYEVRLAETHSLLVIEYAGCRLALRYHPRYISASLPEPRFGSLDRHTRVPDLAIEVQRETDTPRVLALDAKYRLDTGSGSVPQDALDSAYAYMGAIGYDGKPATLGVALLYPGLGAPEIYPSGVAVLPCLPGMPDHLAAWIDECLPHGQDERGT